MLVVGIALGVAPSLVGAAVIVDQPANVGDGSSRASQVFPDFANFSTYQFDDFTTTQTYQLGALTVYGYEAGDSSLNTAVTAEIWTGVPTTPGSPHLVTSVTGSEVGQNLVFDFGGYSLAAGTWWLTAYVTRDQFLGGQWFWQINTPVTGSQSYFYNPGGGFAHGTTAQPGSDVYTTGEANQAFKLESVSSPVPEIDPAGIGAVLAIVGGALGVLERRRLKPIAA